MTNQDPIERLLGEEWKPIPDFEQYQISNLGRIFGPSKKILSPGDKDRPYLKVDLCRDGKKHTFRVHSLVLITFVGPRPKGLQAAHINGNSKDNRLCNLKYVTRRENMEHQAQHGTLAIGERQGKSKLKIEDVLSIKRRFKEVGAVALASEFGVNPAHIRKIASGGAWVRALAAEGKDKEGGRDG